VRRHIKFGAVEAQNNVSPMVSLGIRGPAD